MTIWSIFHHRQPVKVMREVKPLNTSREEAKGKQDFCSLSLSLQETLQGAQTSQCDITLCQYPFWMPRSLPVESPEKTPILQLTNCSLRMLTADYIQVECSFWIQLKSAVCATVNCTNVYFLMWNKLMRGEAKNSLREFLLHFSLTVGALPHHTAFTVCPKKAHKNLEVWHKPPGMPPVRHGGAGFLETPSVRTEVYVQNK